VEFSPEIVTHRENSASEFARCLEPVGAESAEPGEMPIVAAIGIDIAYDEVGQDVDDEPNRRPVEIPRLCTTVGDTGSKATIKKEDS